MWVQLQSVKITFHSFYDKFADDDNKKSGMCGVDMKMKSSNCARNFSNWEYNVNHKQLLWIFLVCALHLFALCDLITLCHHYLHYSSGIRHFVQSTKIPNCRIKIEMEWSPLCAERKKKCFIQIFIRTQSLSHTQRSHSHHTTEHFSEKTLQLAPHHLCFDALFRLSHKLFLTFLFNAFVMIRTHTHTQTFPSIHTQIASRFS